MSQHLKRYPAPDGWQIGSKSETFVVKPSPGPHSEADGVPLLVILRDKLGLADDRREAEYAVNNQNVLVNNEPVNDEKRSVGLFDTISFPASNEFFWLIFDEEGKWVLRPVDEQKTKYRCGEIISKQQVTGGATQLTLHNGDNTEVQDPSKYSVGDSLLIDNSDKKIIDHYPYEESSLLIVSGGSHPGQIGRRVSVNRTGLGNNTVIFETLDGEKLETIEDYVVTVGEEYIRPELEIRGKEIKSKGKRDTSMIDHNDDMNHNPRELIERIKTGESESPAKDYQQVVEYYQSEPLSPEKVVDLYELREAARSKDITVSEVEAILDEYFTDIPDSESRADQLKFGVPEDITFEQIRERLSIVGRIGQNATMIPESSVEREQKKYLFGVNEVMKQN